MDKLLACPFCGGSDFSIEMKEYRHLNSSSDWYYLRCESAGCSAKADYPSRDGLITKWNTRAAPDVPELVRYDLSTHDAPSGGWYEISQDSNGEYVRHDQAAAVISGLELVSDDLDKRENFWVNKAKQQAKELDEFKAKLAKIEKQAPVAWRWRSRFNGGAWDSWERGRFNQPLPPFMEVEEQPLYTAPVASDADLRAERETITGYVSSNDKSVISKGGGWCILVHARQTEIYSNPVTVAALNPSETRT